MEAEWKGGDRRDRERMEGKGGKGAKGPPLCIGMGRPPRMVNPALPVLPY